MKIITPNLPQTDECRGASQASDRPESKRHVELPNKKESHRERSRLSDIPAPGVPESGTVSQFCCGDDATPGCQDNGDAGNLLGNPDIRVPKRIEKEDRLRARGAKQGGNADGDERRGNE
ncbi:hypothetical protein NDU88_001383 [Pleurodeles waltl]|uniref:Uncharacterized protein n=1 Tax=Pleurodeles waltl TaxID=8319 RepID=A0AAV7P3T0_PLEWA|nr:hypothetical protein NDU88_001383 [Pleurodeles waltl]